MAFTNISKLPIAHDELAAYIAKKIATPIQKILEPFRQYEAQLREVYAQERNNPVLDDPYLNVLPLFTQSTSDIKTRARNLEAESQGERDRYIMVLPDDKRRPDGSPAVVASLKEFRHNFNIFSESSLVDMDWDNVVAAGSSAVNCLLPVPNNYKTSKRALRQYYHEKFCPASDVDLFLYGLNEEQAIEKIKQIETRIRDSILSETTVVRTKNAITICSQYPTRHVQIVLRVYKSISEILTGFDIDCSGAAYDGKQVYTTPRALASYITQINPIDLSRRSPSYENRLSKYSHRNFEVYWPELDRSRIDPTIFERNFGRTVGLARLLVLERLPTTNSREQYMKKRREERGRPDLGYQFQHKMHGNIKDAHEDEVADWVNEEEVSNYHTFTIPYGVRFHAKKIEKLCYTRDLLLNAEWNQQNQVKPREVYLHRHPAFFGRVEDVITDCCSTCPQPVTREEHEIAEKESEIYVSGKCTFRIEDPGRQQIGSFHPLTENDWTEMAYVGNTARLCQAIVDEDIEHVEDWLAQEGADCNQRDYTGRTPLHLATSSSTPQIVKCLVDHGARLVARLGDGRTALHLAAARGNADMVKILLDKSSANQEEEEAKQDLRRKARDVNQNDDQESRYRSNQVAQSDSDTEESEGEMMDDADSDDEVHSIATGSFVKVGKDDKTQTDESLPLDDNDNDPDFYSIDVVAWDSHCSALHFAILGGHVDVVKLLCQDYAADVLNPVKFGNGSHDDSRAAILPLVLALALPIEKAVVMAEILLSLGATSSQAEVNGITAFHRYVKHGGRKLIESLFEHDKIGLKAAINHITVTGYSWRSNATSPLMTAIDKGDAVLVLRLLEAGANPQIDFDSWLKGAKVSFEANLGDYERNQGHFKESTEQPLIIAIMSSQPGIAVDLLEKGAESNVITKDSHGLVQSKWSVSHRKGRTALDLVRDSLKTLREYTENTALNHQASGNNRGYFNAGKNTHPEPPESPQGTDEFLRKFDKDSYQHWVVSADIKEKLDDYKETLERFEQEKQKHSNQEGLQEKKQAIQDIIVQLESVEEALQKKSAKTFRELYPEIQESSAPSNHIQTEKSTAYCFDFNFLRVTDLTEVRRIAYIELFEAAWRGDLEKIKSLTLASWGASENEPPLKIAVWDSKNNNCFSLAFLRGHQNVAKAILEIAQAQWSPKDESKVRYTMTGEDYESCEGSKVGSDEEQPEFYREIVDDQFTVENIGQVSMQVKSQVFANAMLNWDTPTFVMREGRVEDLTNCESLLFFAMKTNDQARLKFLVDMDIYHTKKQPDPEDESESSRLYAFPEREFQDAIRLGRIDMLADVIKRTGAGIPLEQLVKKSGVEMKAKPRYYQGLTVYGKKRSDWANAGRNLIVRDTGSKAPPLLMAAIEGSLKSVQWFVSDTPMNHYLEFGKSKTAMEDPRLKHLKSSQGGFDRAISKWLGIQNDLVIHCAVMGPLADETNRVIKYLIQVCPLSLETKSDHGYTPLYLACLLGRVQFAKTLIEAGADQSVKDTSFNNIIHAALTNGPELDQLQELLDLLDPEFRSDLFLQRNHLTHNGDTPVHFWLKTANPSPHNWGYRAEENLKNVEILKMLLKYSGGHDLEAFNGSGMTCLHSAVLRQLPEHMKVMLEHNPKLLYRENSVGRTPAEIAYDRFIFRKVSRPAGVQLTYENHNMSVVNKSPELFLKPSLDSAKEIQELVWEVAQEYLLKFPGKRRLVSLNEANDVARRLGESYAWQRYYSKSNNTAVDAGNDDREDEDKPEDKDSDFVTAQYATRKSLAWVKDWL
ncbi:uncharacterized protein BCR38DRAFT_235854 [Pseudomassariella vexata]|uniref:Ankyrin repeat protein n=1 Tax=Pseudomassariella vexata TaxID=1141098 RepID=A0A1Y2DUD6_9PEZI|nr:uncharacterized protein BCR38DRAFT_235854 [Pseudomassariella vexata]ORY62245.1 hypothetical protein BCR38DRAFT_235854 [Pseudomassariella vexata]